MDIIANDKHVYYVEKLNQCLCGEHFEPIYDACLDFHFEGGRYVYCGINFYETTEHCEVCVQSAED